MFLGRKRILAQPSCLDNDMAAFVLTGRTRLPGFGGEWEEGSLGLIAQLHLEHVVPDPAANDFAIAEEVTVEGNHTKRPDIVLYVNGIAAGVLELKRSIVSVSEGIRQNLDNQKKGFIRPFFATIHLVMAGNETEGLSDLARAQLRQRWGTMRKVTSSLDRIRKIVDDILMDMENNDRLQSGRGNAMLVSDSVYAACRFFQAFSETDLKDRCAIVTSYTPAPGDITGEETGDDKEYGYVIDYKDLFRSLEGAIMDYTGDAFEGYDREDVEGLLKDRLEQGRKRLEETREAVKALCETVEPPYDTDAYLRYFCHGGEGDAGTQPGDSERKRLALCRMVAACLRAYANLANEMTEVGYTEAERQTIKDEVGHYEKVRQEVKLASGDYVDLKVFEPAMRHLLDNYIRADDSEVISAFDDMTLVDLLVRDGAGAIDELPEGIRSSEGAVAETIENNVRRLIVDEMAVNPKYYEKMSAVLDALIKQLRLDDDAIRLAVVSHLGWIQRKRAEFEQQDRQSQRDFVSGESRYFEGRRYRLDVVESRGTVGIRLRNNAWMEMRVRPATGRDAREALLYRWYRAQLRQHIPEMIAKWESRVGVHVADWRIRRMKTRWGSCNAGACRIWLNSELAKKPLPCLEYVVVHEMAHLAEPSHNERFREILDRVMPSWRLRAEELNRTYLADEAWGELLPVR